MVLFTAIIPGNYTFAIAPENKTILQVFRVIP